MQPFILLHKKSHVLRNQDLPIVHRISVQPCIISPCRSSAPILALHPKQTAIAKSIKSFDDHKMMKRSSYIRKLSANTCNMVPCHITSYSVHVVN